MTDAPASDGGHPEQPGSSGRDADRRRLYNDDRDHVVPAKTHAFGMWVFLLGLAILFSATMLLYVLLRLRAQEAHPLGELRGALTNAKLFLSTAIVLAASVTIHVAVLRIRRERKQSFLRWLIASLVLALAFLAVQTPAMIELLGLQPPIPPDATPLAEGGRPITQFYKFLFILVLLHALHVVGGVIYLVVVTRRALQGRYDHEHYTGPRHAALYWHFLDVVWLVMFGTFLLFG